MHNEAKRRRGLDVRAPLTITSIGGHLYQIRPTAYEVTDLDGEPLLAGPYASIEEALTDLHHAMNLDSSSDLRDGAA